MKIELNAEAAIALMFICFSIIVVVMVCAR